jgi:hypothetical protein
MKNMKSTERSPDQLNKDIAKMNLESLEKEN